MGRRVLPVVLTALAAFADARGAYGLAFDALLGAIPFAAVAGLVGFGEYLERREDALQGLQALLWAVALALLVLSCAARSPASRTDSLPALGTSALVCRLAVLALKTCLAVAPHVRRLALAQPAKP